jgi:hypothetical protein
VDWTLSLASQLLVDISNRDTQFLFNTVVETHDIHVKRKAFGIIGNDTLIDPHGVIYCGPISEYGLKAPSLLLISRLENNNPSLARFMEFLSSDGFLASCIFILA